MICGHGQRSSSGIERWRAPSALPSAVAGQERINRVRNRKESGQDWTQDRTGYDMSLGRGDRLGRVGRQAGWLSGWHGGDGVLLYLITPLFFLMFFTPGSRMGDGRIAWDGWFSDDTDGGWGGGGHIEEALLFWRGCVSASRACLSGQRTGLRLRVGTILGWMARAHSPTGYPNGVEIGCNRMLLHKQTFPDQTSP